MVKAINYKIASSTDRRTKRIEYVIDQGGNCYYCKRDLATPPNQDRSINWNLFPGGKNFLKYPVHLHHSHETGLTLGAVHAYCNAVLWQYEGE